MAHAVALAALVAALATVPPAPLEGLHSSYLVKAALVLWPAADADTLRVAVNAAAQIGHIVDVDPIWLVAVAGGETGGTFSATARGDKGRSLGLCQIQLATARRGCCPWATETLLVHPWWNVVVAGLHYQYLIAKHGRKWAQTFYACGWRCGHKSRKFALYRRLLSVYLLETTWI